MTDDTTRDTTNDATNDATNTQAETQPEREVVVIMRPADDDPAAFMPAWMAPYVPAIRATVMQGYRALAYIKLVTASGWAYYVTEYDPATSVMYGACVATPGAEMRFEYTSLVELATAPTGEPVTRDVAWQPIPLWQASLGGLVDQLG